MMMVLGQIVVMMMLMSSTSLVLKSPTIRVMTSSSASSSASACRSPWTLQRLQHSATTALSMVRTRGLEKTRQGATPTEGSMILYIKAGPDGTSVGDCPFAHFVRLVLEEKGLDYTVQPCTAETKPQWLVEHYQGKMPALRHRKECYTESGTIADYLEFFFPEPNLQFKKSTAIDVSSVVDGFFPAVAQYIKTPEGQDEGQLQALHDKLTAMNQHFVKSGVAFVEGDSMTLSDCRLLPQLYHLQTAIEGFKQGIPNIQDSYPQVFAYYERCASRPSFQATIYPKDTVLWGWGNARK